MNPTDSARFDSPTRRPMLALIVGAALLACLLCAGAARADTSTFGSDLQATPTLDSANGADHQNLGGTGPVILPDPHYADDIAWWNTSLASGGPAGSPVAGQLLSVRVKGCAVQDPSSPSQTSQGVPVNEFHIQTLTPAGAHGYHANQTSGPLIFPFCGFGGVSEQAVSSFEPVHMCIQAGEIVALNSLGGFVPSTSGAPWYPQGVPFRIFARSAGSTVNSFDGAGPASGGAYDPTSPHSPQQGYGVEPGLEMLAQSTVGSGDDAYGLCPGGRANEPSAVSNAITCDFGPGSHLHPSCDAQRPAAVVPAAAIAIHAQRVGVNRRRRLKLAVYCANRECDGTAMLELPRNKSVLTTVPFKLPAGHAAKIAARITQAGLRAIRKAPRHQLKVLFMTKLDNGSSASHTITLKI